MNTFELARSKGFVFNGAREWMNTSDSAKMHKLAQDAALITTPNSTVPAELNVFIDTQVIEILTAIRNAKKIFSEVKKGDWTTPYALFRVQEYTGQVTPYADYADGGVSGINENWPKRAQYIFQTTIKYGDLESDMSSIAKLNLASEKQKAAARAIEVAQNKFYLYGVTGKEIYGLLNDPSLPAAITAGTAAAGGTLWSAKTADEIYKDVIKLWTSLRTKSQGNINEDTPLILALPPELNSYLAYINTLGLSVRQMLKNEFGDRLEFVELPELYNSTSGSQIFLIAKDILGSPVGQLGFGEKFRTHPVVRETSSFKQKVSATTYGCILYYPFAVAHMAAL